MGKKLQKQKILVALSGGVDSSVAAALLVRQGFDVTAAYMVNYKDKLPDGGDCWVPDYEDALRVAAKLGIPLIKLDFTKEYKKFVLDYMYKEYAAGRTPNPDVLCNKYIKFGVWLDKARKLGFDKLATGHYARLSPSFHLLQAQDADKDQTYFLHQLTQEQLRHVLFPIGEYKKAEVRKMAAKFALPTAQKEESMGICFVGEVPMKEFLMKKIKPKPGKIIYRGEEAGTHDGLAFYTIGERIGIGGGAERLYVLVKNFNTNELVVGSESDPLLFSKKATIADVNWLSGRQPKMPLKCKARLRHRQLLQDCVVNKNIIIFSKPQRAVTPGQFAVFYKAGECLGGGVIV